MLVILCCDSLAHGPLTHGSLYADWPEFRGPSRDGRATAAAIATRWSADEGIRWRTPLPGEGWSSPVVVGGSVYLTAAIPDDSTAERPTYELVLLIVDVKTGEIRRQVTLFVQAADAAAIHAKNSHASPTPVVDQGNVYVHFGPHGTACTTLAGEVVWRNDGLRYAPVHGNGGSPAVIHDVLVFSRDGAETSEITALERRTGRLAWQTGRNVEAKKKFSFCTPLLLDVDGRSQVIVPGSNVVQSLDPRSGAEFWRVTYDGYSVVPRPIFASDLVFVCTGFDRPKLLAIDPRGEGDVTETHVRWVADSNVPKTPSLVAFDGRIAMISDDGIATSLAAKTGDVLWKKRIGGNFSASPILVGRHLFLMRESGTCTVLDVGAEPVVVAENALNERTLASPAVVDEDLLVRTEDALYRITDAAN